MMTTSEIAVVAVTWGLTAVGGFFSVRAALRKRKLSREAKLRSANKPTVTNFRPGQ